jgi:hypothetical protein
MEMDQIRWLLETVNVDLEVKLDVGFIVQGWRCKLDLDTEVWDHNFVKNTSITYVPLERPDGDVEKARPVIVCNPRISPRKWSPSLSMDRSHRTRNYHTELTINV